MRLALAPPIAAVFILAIIPVLSAVALGAADLPRLLAEPSLVAAGLRSLLLGETSVAIGWPVGVAAALALWGAAQAQRRVTLAASLLVVLMPPDLAARGFAVLAAHAPLPDAWLAMLLAAHAAPSAAIVTMIVAGALNRLDPAMLRGAAASGASLWQAMRLVLLPPLAPWLVLAAAAAFAISLGQTVLDAALTPPGHRTLAGLLAIATRQADVMAAPELLALYALATAPLLVLALLALLR